MRLYTPLLQTLCIIAVFTSVTLSSVPHTSAYSYSQSSYPSATNNPSNDGCNGCGGGYSQSSYPRTSGGNSQGGSNNPADKGQVNYSQSSYPSSGGGGGGRDAGASSPSGDRGAGVRTYEQSAYTGGGSGMNGTQPRDSSQNTPQGSSNDGGFGGSLIRNIVTWGNRLAGQTLAQIQKTGQSVLEAAKSIAGVPKDDKFTTLSEITPRPKITAPSKTTTDGITGETRPVSVPSTIQTLIDGKKAGTLTEAQVKEYEQMNLEEAKRRFGVELERRREGKEFHERIGESGIVPGTEDKPGFQNQTPTLNEESFPDKPEYANQTKVFTDPADGSKVTVSFDKDGKAISAEKKLVSPAPGSATPDLFNSPNPLDKALTGQIPAYTVPKDIKGTSDGQVIAQVRTNLITNRVEIAPGTKPNLDLAGKTFDVPPAGKRSGFQIAIDSNGAASIVEKTVLPETKTTDYSKWKGLGDENGQKLGQSYSGPKGLNPTETSSGGLTEAAKKAAVTYSGYTVPKVSATDDEVERMARMMLAESPIRNEKGDLNTDGLVKVADVIRNRVLSDDFPDTVDGVLSQSKQFEPYASKNNNFMGQKYGPENPNFEAAKAIAKSVLDGTSVPSAVSANGDAQVNYGNVPAINEYAKTGKASKATLQNFNTMADDPDSVTIKDAFKPGVQHTFGNIGNPDVPNFTNGEIVTPQGNDGASGKKSVEEQINDAFTVKPNDSALTKTVKAAGKVITSSPAIQTGIKVFSGLVSGLEKITGVKNTSPATRSAFTSEGDGSNSDNRSVSQQLSHNGTVAPNQSVKNNGAAHNQKEMTVMDAVIGLLYEEVRNGVTLISPSSDPIDANLLRKALIKTENTTYTLEYRTHEDITDAKLNIANRKSKYLIMTTEQNINGTDLEFTFVDDGVDATHDGFFADGIGVSEPGLYPALQQRYLRELETLAQIYTAN